MPKRWQKPPDYRLAGWRKLRIHRQAGHLALVALLAGCSTVAGPAHQAESSPVTTSTPPPSVSVAALDGLLLPPDQLNGLLQRTALTVVHSYSQMVDAEVTQPDFEEAERRRAEGCSYTNNDYLNENRRSDDGQA